MSHNASSRSLSPSGYHDARLTRQHVAKKGGRRHAKRQSLKERYFPFHRLPCEIIAEIFVLCLPDFEDVYSSKSKHTAPLLLCNVSLSWRSLALSTPRLWNELSIRIASPNPRADIDLAVSMVESWIARAGELPLSLRLHAGPWDEKGQAEAMVKAHLNIFFRYASRWESVDISLFGRSAVSFPKFGPTPLLRRFEYSTPYPSIPLPFPFASCPLLSAFTWPFSPFLGSSREVDIPWHQLTCITIEGNMSTHQTIHILRTCQMLVQFNVKIDDDTSYSRVRSRRKPVENRSLRSFHICVYQACAGLLQGLTLPALTELSLDIEGDLSITSSLSVHTQLLHLFTRSKCKLEKLRLGDCGFNDGCILQCLIHDSCSSLTVLEIANGFYRPMFTDLVILALTDNVNDGLSEANNVLLPNLYHLSLEMCLSASPGLLGLMVLTRRIWRDNADQLKLLSLTVKEPLAPIDYASLESAEETGLVVYITVDRYTDSEESEFTEDQYDTDDSYATP